MAAKRILVVDDSCMYQRLLSDVIGAHPDMEVVGVASNGNTALQMVARYRPQLLTLDILMPEPDGIQTLLELRKRWPEVRIIMVSSLMSEGSDAALDALALGAHDYVAKPVNAGGVGNIRMSLGDCLLPKIEALCDIESRIPGTVAPATEILSARPVITMTGPVRRTAGVERPDIVVIAVSTGGPDALAKLLLQLPADFPVPICIVQHMPAQFTVKLAARLDAACVLKVREAQTGDKLRAGTVLIAPGDFHMVLDRVGGDEVISLNRNPPENSCRPSADPLFRSAASLYGARCLGVVMTGMGQDGLKGSEALFAAGGTIVVQDKDSSIVWGMPRLVAQAGLAEEQVPLNRLAAAIVERVRPSATSPESQGIGNQNRAASAYSPVANIAQGRSS